MIPRTSWRGQDGDWTEERDEKHTNFYRDERDDNLLKAFRVSTGHGLLQEL